MRLGILRIETCVGFPTPPKLSCEAGQELLISWNQPGGHATGLGVSLDAKLQRRAFATGVAVVELLDGVALGDPRAPSAAEPPQISCNLGLPFPLYVLRARGLGVEACRF
jgi:hypothetical protein